ncbi:MAG: hypothetical protein ACK54H_02905 [Phycisphaerales bacterium]
MPHERARMMEDIEKSRAQAQELLRALIEAKNQVDTIGSKDLYKIVTGASSIDNAIDTARRAVETCDRMLAELKSADGR